MIFPRKKVAPVAAPWWQATNSSKSSKGNLALIAVLAGAVVILVALFELVPGISAGLYVVFDYGVLSRGAAARFRFLAAFLLFPFFP